MSEVFELQPLEALLNVNVQWVNPSRHIRLLGWSLVHCWCMVELDLIDKLVCGFTKYEVALTG